MFGTERPKLVETISWAAGNGDRSENGDYIYGRKRLREIDRRLTYLSKVMKQAKVVDPAAQVERDVVHFGAIVELADEDDERRTLILVGEDEADATAGKINWRAPIARALLGARVGDERIVAPARGREELRNHRDRISRAPGERAKRSAGAGRRPRFRPSPAAQTDRLVERVGEDRQRRDPRRLLVVGVDRPPRRPARVGLREQVVERSGSALAFVARRQRRQLRPNGGATGRPAVRAAAAAAPRPKRGRTI